MLPRIVSCSHTMSTRATILRILSRTATRTTSTTVTTSPTTAPPTMRPRHSAMPPQHPPREVVNVVGIPSVTVQDDQLVVGDSQSSEYLLSYSNPSCSQFPRSVIRRLPRFNSLVHTPQGRRRRLLWHCLALRLAWDATAQYPDVRHAVRRWCTPRVRR